MYIIEKKIDDIESYGAVVMCDADNFKGINDTYGHNLGDRVLKLIAENLNSNTRHDDIVCRYGGDEFLVIFQFCSLNVVVDRMKKIQESIEKIGIDLGINVTLSIGIAESKNGLSLDDAIIQADKALYFSKGNGKSQISIYERVKNKTK